jgi:hypothetical protein
MFHILTNMKMMSKNKKKIIKKRDGNEMSEEYLAFQEEMKNENGVSPGDSLTRKLNNENGNVSNFISEENWDMFEKLIF